LHNWKFNTEDYSKARALGWFWDLEKARFGAHKIEELATSGIIFPGHDPMVLKRYQAVLKVLQGHLKPLVLSCPPLFLVLSVPLDYSL